MKFGELDNRPSERTERLLSAFTKAGVNAEIPPNINSALWGKFVFIAPWSGIGSVTRTNVGVWRSMPQTRHMAKTLMQEVIDVAQAKNISLADDALATTMSIIDALPAEVTTSMQRDIMEGRPSELEFQNGSVVRQGKDLGVSTPINEFVYYSLIPQEMQARDEKEG